MVKTEQGVLLGDRYRLTRRIAAGGMGEVWEAADTVLGRDVAVKIMKEELRTASTFLERFRAEARHAGGLGHPGIARVFDYGEGPDVAFLVMELVLGQPLSELMTGGEELSDAAKVSILRQSADALQAAHDAGVIHRDVKPGNLLVRPDGTVKVTDFGIARALSSVPLTDTGQLIGTPAYMSPEQASGRVVTPSSDIYSLGVVGYELFAGRPPFVRDTPVALALAHVQDLPPPLPDSVPSRVAKVIESALAKDPRKRPRTAGEFSDRLRSALPAAADIATHPGQDHSHADTMLAPVARSHTPGPDGIAAAVPVVVSAAPAASGKNGRLVRPARHRQAHVPTMLFVALIALIGIGIWTATRGGDSQARRSTSSATIVTQTPAPKSSAAQTDPSTSAAATPLPITAAPTTVPITPEPTTPPTVPPTVAPNPPVTKPATAAPSTAPAPASAGKVGQDEAIRFVTSYYSSLAAGDYQTTWPLLSEEFRAQRNLTFERYVAYWEHHSITLNDLRFREGPGSDEGRVRFDARYSSNTGTINETDEITLRHQTDGTLIIVAQEIV